MHPLFTLSQKRAVVTGATKGIGRATTKLLLELGAEVLAVARTPADLEALHQAYAPLGVLHTCGADVATEEGRAKVLAACGSGFGESLPIHVLINNVGTNIRKPLLNYPLTDLRQLMATNLESAMQLSNLLYPVLAAAKGASIVNVSSVSSLNVVGTSTAAYAMTKGALDNLTRWQAVEWGGVGIRVNSVHPWYTRTELTTPLLEQDALLNHIVAATPIGRVAGAEEVAAVIAFACMPAASYVTGSQLLVDGGYLALGVSGLL